VIERRVWIFRGVENQPATSPPAREGDVVFPIAVRFLESRRYGRIVDNEVLPFVQLGEGDGEPCLTGLGIVVEAHQQRRRRVGAMMAAKRVHEAGDALDGVVDAHRAVAFVDDLRGLEEDERVRPDGVE
jgi:hypothetical protein